jgi:hypothetical protein
VCQKQSEKGIFSRVLQKATLGRFAIHQKDGQVAADSVKMDAECNASGTVELCSRYHAIGKAPHLKTF